MNSACIGCEDGVAQERAFYDGDGTGIGMAARSTIECGLADRNGTGVGVQKGPIRQLGGCYHDSARVGAGIDATADADDIEWTGIASEYRGFQARGYPN